MKDEVLMEAIRVLPLNYSFEIEKSIWRLKCANSKRVALQFPEGLLAYSCIIADILERWANVEVVIMGDVTYGACCVDDFTARALGCDFLIHYGHSCLVPIQKTTIETLYVFVDIKIDLKHFIDTVKLNFPDPDTRLAFIGTIQFTASLQQAREELAKYYKNLSVPQCKPLSPGEVLGCTSCKLQQANDAIIYLADGRFHLESMMISNPSAVFYQYEPYSKVFSRERYEFQEMKRIRYEAILNARSVDYVGVILGTLGRQGSPAVLNHIETLLNNRGIKHIVILLSEVFPQKLDLFKDIKAWIQIACPRLSIDWGASFTTPLLNPYEATVAFGDAPWEENTYPMDFYSKDGGSWTVYNAK
uniref:2-(3-amino-3-carboxypropyl)histidine synthase subunit 1 n=1 Tax=Arcella intermedia TaxID=1963864 RepID=A0A6B2L796_9EUKA